MTDTPAKNTTSQGQQLTNDDADINMGSTIISNDDSGFNFPNIETTDRVFEQFEQSFDGDVIISGGQTKNIGRTAQTTRERQGSQHRESSPSNAMKQSDSKNNFFDLKRPYQTVLPSLVRTIQKSGDLAQIKLLDGIDMGDTMSKTMLQNDDTNGDQHCKNIIKGWVKETLQMIKSHLNDDKIMAECLKDCLSSVDQKAIFDDDSSIEFKPQSKFGNSRLLMQSVQNTKISDILSKQQDHDGFGIKFHVLIEDFEERHQEISDNWEKAKSIFDESLGQYTKESKQLDLKSQNSGNNYDGLTQKRQENHNNLMTPMIQNFQSQLEDVQNHQVAADKALNYMQTKFEKDVEDFVKRYQTISSFEVKFRNIPEMVEWQSYDELPCTKTLNEKSHTELLALKLKRISWSEDTDGKLQRIKVLLNDNSTIDCGFSGMYFPKQFDFDPEIKIQSIKIQRLGLKLCAIEFFDTKGTEIGVIGKRSFDNECTQVEYNIEPNEQIVGAAICVDLSEICFKVVKFPF